MTEQEARELIAKALEADGWPNSAVYVRNGSNGAVCAAIRTLLPPLATSELQRRALEACEALHNEYGTTYAHLSKTAQAVCDVGRESLAVKKPKGPWRQDGHRAIHESGRSRRFYDEQGRYDPAACSEFVAEQNEREAAR